MFPPFLCYLLYSIILLFGLLCSCVLYVSLMSVVSFGAARMAPPSAVFLCALVFFVAIRAAPKLMTDIRETYNTQEHNKPNNKIIEYKR